MSENWNDKLFEVAIVGGGLSGLSLAIQLSRAGHTVIVFEKEQYPFHRVCGEYISLESWDFLNGLGVDLGAMQVPIIRKLQVSSSNGRLLEQDLPLGGFGISRYVLDYTLSRLAINEGVTIAEHTKISDVEFNGEEYSIIGPAANCRAKLAFGCFGKRSNIDVKWKRHFITAGKNRLNNYVGVKYHVRGNFPDDTIALHTFRNGYCGLAKVEAEKYNLCYLTAASNLQDSGNNIAVMEEEILCRNPYLHAIFRTAKKLDAEPVTISQISFDRKSQCENNVLLVGDAAGMITPLCGNGMSMALHASKLAFIQSRLYLRGRITRAEMERRYSREWQRKFARRLRMGRFIQRLSLNTGWMNFFIRGGKLFPGAIRAMIRSTHGETF